MFSGERKLRRITRERGVRAERICEREREREPGGKTTEEFSLGAGEKH